MNDTTGRSGWVVDLATKRIFLVRKRGPGSPTANGARVTGPAWAPAGAPVPDQAIADRESPAAPARAARPARVHTGGEVSPLTRDRQRGTRFSGRS
jgi:hypothetical protein